VRLGFDENETSRFCHWHIPAAHALESWGDVCAFDGTVTLIQPLIEPLFEGKSAHELIDALFQPPGWEAYDIVRGYWQAQKWPNFEKAWRTALNDGVVAGSAGAAQQVKLAAKPPAKTAQASGKLAPGAAAADFQAHLGQCGARKPRASPT
jgi:molybdopterin-containing oxidoreductase family iron-sulfur binding subunit